VAASVGFEKSFGVREVFVAVEAAGVLMFVEEALIGEQCLEVASFTLPFFSLDLQS
jgi:hypothetical protein